MTLDDAFVKALRGGLRARAAHRGRPRRCSTTSTQLTKDATRITPEYHERLRAVGFDDRGILQITLIASWFNYINRVADALGVGRD